MTVRRQRKPAESLAEFSAFRPKQPRVVKWQLVHRAQTLATAGDEIPITFRSEDEAGRHGKAALPQDGEI